MLTVRNISRIKNALVSPYGDTEPPKAIIIMKGKTLFYCWQGRVSIIVGCLCGCCGCCCLLGVWAEAPAISTRRSQQLAAMKHCIFFSLGIHPKKDRQGAVQRAYGR